MGIFDDALKPLEELDMKEVIDSHMRGELEEPKWQICITSKHTGKEQWLGSLFDTEKEARAYADKEVCSRCNGVEVLNYPTWMYMRLQNGRHN